MLKFRPSNLTQKRPNISFNELQLIALIEKALSDNSLRGLLYKRSSNSAKWRLKWFLLFENLLFYFDLGSQKQQDQQQQKEQKELQRHEQRTLSKSSRKSSFSSLIRRQSKQTGTNQQQSDVQNQRGPDFVQVSLTPTHRTTRNDVLLEPRRASVSDTFTRVGKTSQTAATTPTTDQPTQRPHQQQQQLNAPLAPPRSRQRLSSDPQNVLSANVLNADATTKATTTNLNARSELSLNNYEQSLLNSNSTGTPSYHISKTLNSSSISGVSNHFQIHNEQTIGRSTTTTAGKTNSNSANYSSLLNRKIGVIFLEGSYCERLVDSAGNFIGDSGALRAPTSATLAKRCSSSCADSDLVTQFSSAFSHNKSSNSIRTNSLIGPLRTKQDEEESEVSNWLVGKKDCTIFVLLFLTSNVYCSNISISVSIFLDLDRFAVLKTDR